MKTKVHRIFVLLLTLSFIAVNYCDNSVMFAKQERGEVREWTAKSGHQITGTLIDVEAGTVQIALTNGKTVAIKIEQLSSKDQDFIESRNEQQELNPFKIQNNSTRIKKNNTAAIDWKTPLDVLKSEAEKDNPDALLELANRYFEGCHGCPCNTSKASKLFQKGAEHADACSPAGQTCKGFCYMNGIGVTKDELEAAKWYRKAAEQGFAEAQNNLGDCYAEGLGVAANSKEAVKWFRKAAEQGFAQAETNLGLCYGEGEGVSKNPKESVKWFRKAAEQGFAQAQYCLGICYDIGEGVDEDPDEAIKWLRKSAKQGFQEAIEALCELDVE